MYILLVFQLDPIRNGVLAPATALAGRRPREGRSPGRIRPHFSSYSAEQFVQSASLGQSVRSRREPVRPHHIRSVLRSHSLRRVDSGIQGYTRQFVGVKRSLDGGQRDVVHWFEFQLSRKLCGQPNVCKKADGEIDRDTLKYFILGCPRS